jgi:hypothetical protein
MEQGYYEWDITEYVSSKVGEKITLGFYDNSASGNAVSFSSKEGNHPPELNIILHNSEYNYPPEVPSPVFASAISPTEINLSWTDNSVNEEGFRIERKEEGGTFGEIAVVNANVTSYSESGLQKSTTYYYRVQAFNAEGNSEYSEEVPVTTYSDDMIELIYPVMEDTYVRGGASADINYGAETDLIVKKGTKEDFFRNTLVKFDLTGEDVQTEKLVRAALRLYANKSEKCKVYAAGIDDNWSESDVTWATAPAIGEEFAAAEMTSDQKYYEWDITNYLTSELNQDGIISVCLQEHPGTNINIYFNSKEAADNHPELVLSVTDTTHATDTTGTSTIHDIEFELNIYPNPAISVLNVATPDGRIDKLAIYSLTGQMMIVMYDIENQARLNIEHLDKGIYLLKAEGEFGTFTRKFIKAR